MLHKITVPGRDREYTVSYDVRIRNVEGVDRSYGPGGFSIGITPEGREGRRVSNGDPVPGPWGYLVGLAGVIDNHGGTRRELDEAKAEDRYIESVAEGDEFLIDGQRYVLIRRGWNKNDLQLDPVGPLKSEIAEALRQFQAELNANADQIAAILADQS